MNFPKNPLMRKRLVSDRFSRNMAKEYIIWGVKKGETDEEPLFTKATTSSEANKVISILQEKHGVTKPRIQIIDTDEPLEWDATKMVK